jgi:hypothetical protein
MKKYFYVINVLLLSGFASAGELELHRVGAVSKVKSSSKVRVDWASNLTGLTGDLAGRRFTYDVQIVSPSHAELTVTKKGEALGSSPTGFSDGEQVTIKVLNISDPAIKLKGFVGFSLANVSSNQGALVNGKLYLAKNLPVAKHVEIEGGPDPEFHFTSEGNVALRYVEFAFESGNTPMEVKKPNRKKKGKN